MRLRKLLKNKYIIVGFGVFLASCGQNDFNYGKVHNIMEGTPVNLDGEYVTLTPQLVDCGVEYDLWEAPFDTGSREHKVARLKQAGRDLKFGDDVSIGDMGRPYVQIRGEFNLNALDITSDKDGPEPNTRLVTAKVGVTINHRCFPEPLLLEGVRHGNFVQDQWPVFLFRFNNGWTMDRIVH
ncbi:MAG TPA: hypothetical protein VMB85_03465 [Bryobacteraceae bacterium]|jgi:hypothetical protein|nr:hypothetical protein [Bryobacteraceae bacterium]